MSLETFNCCYTRISNHKLTESETEIERKWKRESSETIILLHLYI